MLWFCNHPNLKLKPRSPQHEASTNEGRRGHRHRLTKVDYGRAASHMCGVLASGHPRLWEVAASRLGGFVHRVQDALGARQIVRTEATNRGSHRPFTEKLRCVWKDIDFHEQLACLRRYYYLAMINFFIIMLTLLVLVSWRLQLQYQYWAAMLAMRQIQL